MKTTLSIPLATEPWLGPGGFSIFTGLYVFGESCIIVRYFTGQWRIFKLEVGTHNCTINCLWNSKEFSVWKGWRRKNGSAPAAYAGRATAQFGYFDSIQPTSATCWISVGTGDGLLRNRDRDRGEKGRRSERCGQRPLDLLPTRVCLKVLLNTVFYPSLSSYRCSRHVAFIIWIPKSGGENASLRSEKKLHSYKRKRIGLETLALGWVSSEPIWTCPIQEQVVSRVFLLERWHLFTTQLHRTMTTWVVRLPFYCSINE